jgi:hypothetical protein
MKIADQWVRIVRFLLTSGRFGVIIANKGKLNAVKERKEYGCTDTG